jgi:hypothetical protein
MPQPCRDDERDETVEKDPHDQTQAVHRATQAWSRRACMGRSARTLGPLRSNPTRGRWRAGTPRREMTASERRHLEAAERGSSASEMLRVLKLPDFERASAMCERWSLARYRRNGCRRA